MTGVVLMNLGGPEDLAAVRPFLRNLLGDPDVIQLPAGILWQWAFARLVAWRREKIVRGFYEQIGGGSPLRRLTEEQARALSAALGGDVRVYVAMRCWNPTFADAVAAARRDGCRRLVALPLFPQFSRTTTGSCLKALRAEARRGGAPLAVEAIDSYPDFPPYLEALAGTVREALAALPVEARDRVPILFSAHGLPKKYIDQGDRYLDEIRRTVRGVLAVLGRDPETGGRLAFQSKLGRARWLEPNTETALERLAREGEKDVAIVPVSFVSDHIETLYEIDILFGGTARRLGLRLHRARALNADPAFIDALAALARPRLDATSAGAGGPGQGGGLAA